MAMRNRGGPAFIVLLLAGFGLLHILAEARTSFSSHGHRGAHFMDNGTQLLPAPGPPALPRRPISATARDHRRDLPCCCSATPSADAQTRGACTDSRSRRLGSSGSRSSSGCTPRPGTPARTRGPPAAPRCPPAPGPTSPPGTTRSRTFPIQEEGHVLDAEGAREPRGRRVRP